MATGSLDFLSFWFGITALPFEAILFWDRTLSFDKCGMAPVEHQNKKARARADLS